MQSTLTKFQQLCKSFSSDYSYVDLERERNCTISSQISSTIINCLLNLMKYSSVLLDITSHSFLLIRMTNKMMKSTCEREEACYIIKLRLAKSRNICQMVTYLIDLRILRSNGMPRKCLAFHFGIQAQDVSIQDNVF